MKNNTKKTTENEIIVNEELKSQNNQEVAAEFQPGSHRVQQVVDTIEFEFIRNKKKTLIIMAVDAIVFLLFFIIEQTRQSRGAEACADPVAYVNSYLGMIDLLILITACSFGGFVIAKDYKERTGHLLFPKTTKERLLIGRLAATYILTAFTVLFYYSLVAIVTVAKCDSFPAELFFKSFGWAIFYLLGVLIYVIFWSSILKSSTMAIIISLLSMWMLFSIVEGVLAIMNQMEPVFLLNYYARIITNIFNMPEQRYYDQQIPVSEGQTFVIRNWTTPSITGAAIGITVYSVVLLGLAYYIFKRRQFKN